MEYKKDVPAIGVTLIIKSDRKESKLISVEGSSKKAKFYFIQLGPEAKLKSFDVLEILRKNKIFVHQTIHKDKLATQLSEAEILKIPYIIIMGHKEAMENSVLVRNMETRAQETVSLLEMVVFLKSLR
jgi:histidyl-tRNA synthetase